MSTATTESAPRATVCPELVSLAAAIAGGEFGRSKAWCGAHVAIIKKAPVVEPPELDLEPGVIRRMTHRLVVTPHMHELSWLYCRVRDIFYDCKVMDYSNKYEVFGRLGNAAEWCMQQLPDVSAQWLLLVALREAFAMYEELVTGQFCVMLITVNNRIDDDFREDARPSGQDLMTKTREFFQTFNIQCP
jgi:hypothetical protein